METEANDGGSWPMRSPDIGELAKALAMAQGEIRAAEKDRENDFFKSSYATLSSVWEACRAPLTKNLLSVVQQPVNDGERVGVVTTLLHASGQWMRSTLFASPKDKTPQSMGSAITYVRRYALAAMAGVAPDDDDGDAAQGRGADPKAPSPGPTPGAPATPAAGKMEPTTKTAPSTPRPKGTGAADIVHDGVYITEGQLKVLHITRREAGGQWCTDGGKDEDDARSLWRTKVLNVYRDKDGSRITSSKQLSKAQANHLIDRLTKYASKTKETMAARDAETQITDIMPAKRKPNGMTAATMSITGALKTKDMDASELCAVFGVDDVTEIANEDADKALALVFAWNTPKYAQVLAEIGGVPQ